MKVNKVLTRPDTWFEFSYPNADYNLAVSHFLACCETSHSELCLT